MLMLACAGGWGTQPTRALPSSFKARWEEATGWSSLPAALGRSESCAQTHLEFHTLAPRTSVQYPGKSINVSDEKVCVKENFCVCIFTNNFLNVMFSQCFSTAYQCFSILLNGWFCVLYTCQTPDLPNLPSPGIDWKIWKALYLRGWLVGWLVVITLLSVGRSVGGFEDWSMGMPHILSTMPHILSTMPNTLLIFFALLQT